MILKKINKAEVIFRLIWIRIWIKLLFEKQNLGIFFFILRLKKKRKKVNTTNKEVFVKHFPRKIKEEYFNNFKQKKICYNKKFGKVIKNTNRENTLSNKSQVVAKRFNVNIWAFRTLNQLFKRSFLYSN